MSFNYRQFFQFLFPPSHDEIVLSSLEEKTFLSLSNPRHGVHALSLLPYTHPAVKAAIHLAKFHNHQNAKKLLANVLSQYFQTLPKDTVFFAAPIPLSSIRKRKRGYNQVEEIIKLATKQTQGHIKICTELKRIKDTKPQTSLSRKERLLNVHNAFATSYKSTELLCDAHILLIDDVITTGSTMTAARQALEQSHPSSITCIALAH